MNILNILLAVLTALSIATAYPEPGACSGDCTAIDPCVIRRSSDGVYFKFITFGEIRIYKANDLTGPWSYQGAAIPAGSVIDLPGRDSLWAPDVKLVGDKYIMYYSVSTGGSQTSAIGYATSPSMEYGTWTDHGATGISSTSANLYNAIDPALFLEPASSSYYMTFGSYWSGIFVVPMNDGATQVASGATYTNLAYWPPRNHPLEGSYMYYHDSYYYLFASQGRSGNYNVSLPAAGEEYKVLVCRSSAVTGPFVGPNGLSCLEGGGGVLLASHDNVYGPGGQGVFDDPTHGTVLYYHYANKDISLAKDEYQLGWNVLTWSDGWPVVSS